MDKTISREEARKAINGRPITDFITLQASKKAGRNMFCCPVCGSGTGRNGTGAFHVYPGSNRVICYAGNCFTDKGEDTLGALKIIWQCDETEALKRAGYNLTSGGGSITPEYKENNEHQKHQEHKEHQERPAAIDYTSFYRECHEALLKSPEALEYLHGRGITDESIERFNLGYCAAWKHSVTLENEKKYNKTFPGTKRIIIPRTKETYVARRIDAPANDIEKQYVKQIQGKQKDLFNLEALDRSETPWIVEGELDAISLYQAGAEAVVGIGSTVNAGRILEEMRKHPEKVYLLALDNDPPDEKGNKPGADAQEELTKKMQAAGLLPLPVEPELIYQEAKDANEALNKTPDILRQFVSGFEQAAKEVKANRDEERREELEKRTGAGMLDSFLKVVQSKDFEPIPTGIFAIDNALQGGFTRRTLVLLSGAPGIGKTALAQMITETIARSGRDIVYFNLEMDRNQLLARSLSRIVWEQEKADINALQVLRGYGWTDYQREAITRAAELYKKEIAGRFIYNPDGTSNELNSILSAMQAETDRIKAAGRPEPLVCIDYLNLIDGGIRDAVEGLKTVIYRLKDFAKENNTIVLAITATNRAANKTGIVTQEDGRDSSAVEYSGDLMLGLSYTAIEDGREYETGEEDRFHKPIKAKYDIAELRRLRREAYDLGKDPPAVCNEITLKVLKNRFGEPERRANLTFDGKHSIFTVIQKGFVDVTGQERLPW